MTVPVRDLTTDVPGMRPPTATAVDAAAVRRLRRVVADRLTEEIAELTAAGRPPLLPADVRMLGRSLIAAELAEHVAGQVHAGQPGLSVADEDALAVRGLCGDLRPGPAAGAGG